MKKHRLLALLGLGAALGGCASAPTQSEVNAMLPTRTDLSPGQIAHAAKDNPTQALAMTVMAKPDATRPIVLKIDKPAGTIDGGFAATTAQNREAMGNAAIGANLGGPLGGAMMALGALEAYHNANPDAAGMRYGVMPVVSEPTLDLYRALTPAEQALPLGRQQALMKEEVELIAAVRDGEPDPRCDFGPCVKLLATIEAHEAPTYYILRPENPALRAMGDGGVQITDRKPTFELPAGLAVGDNGFIQFGIDSRTGLANVLPGILPGNTYWSEDKMAALVRKYPPAANWYAVFNTPAPGGKPGDVTWTLMHQGKVVGTGRIEASGS